MISIDLESGQIFIGQTSVAVQMTEDRGCLHLNYPDGPVLRPLSVLERLRLIQYALTADNAPAALAASVLHAATVKPGVGDYRLYEAVALHLAGGGLQAPPIYQAIATVARHTGWHPNQIFSADAAQIDHMAITLTPASSSEWTRVLVLDAGQDEPGALANDLAASLIGRLDDRAGLNQDDAYVSDAAQSLPGLMHDLYTPPKKTSIDDSASQEQIHPRRHQTDGDQPFAFAGPRDASTILEPPDTISSRESNPAGLDQSADASSTGSRSGSPDETSPEMKMRYSPDAGFILKKGNGRGRNNAVPRPLDSIRSEAQPARGKVEPVINSSRPETNWADGLSDPDGSASRLLAVGEPGGPGLTLQRQMELSANFGWGAASSPNGVRPERPAGPDNAGGPSAAHQIFRGRQRLVRPAGITGTHDRPRISHHHTAAGRADELNQDIETFFGHREASVAEELADSLNREADLRGIE
jgi:hypothetical protein